jgi:hypothetical protein
MLPINKVNLADLVDRCIDRKKPFTENGEQFRDAIIWLNVLELVVSSKEKEVIFISNNKKEFASGDKALNEELQDESEKRKVKIHYFSGLDIFIRESCSIKLDYVTDEWLINVFLENNINDEIESQAQFYESMFVGEEVGRGSNEILDQISSISLESVKINKFVTYRLPNNDFFIDVDCGVKAQITAVNRVCDDEEAYVKEMEYETEYDVNINLNVKNKDVIDIAVNLE